MDKSDAKYLTLLVAPLLIVFSVLALLGHVERETAIIGGVLSGLGVVWAGMRFKADMEEAREAEKLVELELRDEFIRQSRLAESYETILNAIPEPVLVLRSDRRVLHANQAVVDLFGHDPIDADLTAALRHPEVLAAADAVLAGNAEHRTVEFSRGGEREQHLVARLVRLPGRPPTGPVVIVALHDLTAIRNTMQMRADFVANVSHELRTPLSTLVGCIETLQGPARDDAEARDRFLALMGEQGSRMTRLVQDLLSLSQIQANEHTRPTEQVQIQDIVPTVARMLEPDAARKNTSIALEIPDDLPTVTGDSDQLQQVFQNLIHNAVKYGPDGSVVRVVGRVENGGRTVAVAIADRGEGIPEEHIPRLTERFYRVDKARSRALGGTGLGLAIVKHILSRHRGSLKIESEVGVGSTFTVLLPVSRKSMAQPRKSEHT